MTKLFINGGSQAVRLPKDLQFQSTDVCIQKYGNGVLITPQKITWREFFKMPRASDDFMENRDQQPVQEREFF